MRGKAEPVGGGDDGEGIIPAYAGKRTHRTRPSPRQRDHPRVCGEKGRQREEGRELGGSSPRVRGKGVF